MAFKEDLKTKSAYIEDLLKQYMPKEEGYQKTIFEAMNYSLSSGGKRLRPILTLESAKIIGGDVKEVIPFCVAIEMIHTYSLIHDDLPAMDNDDLEEFFYGLRKRSERTWLLKCSDHGYAKAYF